MPIANPSSKSIRDLLHHMLVKLHLGTKVSTIVRIPELNLFIFIVVWRKGVVNLLLLPNVVGTIQVLIKRAPLVVSCVVIMGISYENVQRTDKVMVIGTIELVSFNCSTRHSYTSMGYF